MARSSSSEARILQAAREVFLAEGYSAVSTDHLCKAAGVSKTTLYRYFGDMSGVLKAVIKKEGDAFSIEDTPLPETAGEFWQTLRDYGVALLKLLNTQFCLQLDRTMHEEARNHPEIAKIFYDNAYGRSHADLTRLIGHAKAHGFCTHPAKAESLAEHLLCMWEGLSFVRARLALTEKPYPRPKARVLRVLTELFGEECSIS